MSRLSFTVPGLLALSLVGCGPLEVRVGQAEGVKPINGALTASFDTTATTTFKCGDTITGTDRGQTYTVVTKVVTGGCDFTFDQDVEVIGQADYAAIKELKEAVRFVKRVEIDLKRLELSDDKGVKFELSRVRELQLSVNGQQILDVDQLSSVPRTLQLSGDALKLIKDAVKNKQRCAVHVVAHVVVLNGTVPSGTHCEYESQPTLIVSPTDN